MSLGVQSFVGAELARTGRRHTAETVASDVALLAAHGLTNINIDLIAGLPGQTHASWSESLDWIERLKAPHVSVYLLEVMRTAAWVSRSCRAGIAMAPAPCRRTI